MSETSPRWREDFDAPEIALHALHRALTYVNGTIRNGPGGKPGEVVSKMLKSETWAKAIRRLRSDDIRDVHLDRLFL
jgi:hypothetical protein